MESFPEMSVYAFTAVIVLHVENLQPWKGFRVLG